jgi:hypothetical protein
MKIFFAVITALVLVGTAVGTRLGEGEKRILEEFPKSCDGQTTPFKYCCCKDTKDYCVEETFKTDTDYFCKPAGYVKGFTFTSKERLIPYTDGCSQDTTPSAEVRGSLFKGSPSSFRLHILDFPSQMLVEE